MFKDHQEEQVLQENWDNQVRLAQLVAPVTKVHKVLRVQVDYKVAQDLQVLQVTRELLAHKDQLEILVHLGQQAQQDLVVIQVPQVFQVQLEILDNKVLRDLRVVQDCRAQ